MKIVQIVEHKGWSDRIRRRGIRRVAREANIDFGYLSKIVNDEKVCTTEMLERLIVATNKLLPMKEGINE